MMQRAIIVLLFSVLFFVGSFADHRHLKHHGHNHQVGNQHHNIAPSHCKYEATDGSHFDIAAFSSLSADLQFVDESSNTFYFHGCGNLIAQGCAPGSAVCMIDANGNAISYGSAASVVYSDGVQGESTFEAIYGNGDVCGDDNVPRKTLVEFVCSLPEELSESSQVVSSSQSVSSQSELSVSESSQIVSSQSVSSHVEQSVEATIVSAVTDGCFLTLIVKSPNACDVSSYCKSLETEESCRATSKVCAWKNLHTEGDKADTPAAGICVPHHGKRHIESDIYGLVAVLSAIVILTVLLFVGMVCVYIRHKQRKAKRMARMNNIECGATKMSVVNDFTQYEEQQEMVEEAVLTTDSSAAASAPVHIAVFYPGQNATPYTGYGYQPLSLQWAVPQSSTSK